MPDDDRSRQERDDSDPRSDTPEDVELEEKEAEEAEERTSIGAVVVHEAIRREGEMELRRPTPALAWSGLAAGLSMGFSLMTEGLLQEALPAAPWRPLITKLGYAVGFVIVVLGRQQLFTENTLTAVMPLLHRRNVATALNVARLWAVVLAANLVGALLFAALLAGTAVFDEGTRAVFAELGHEAVAGSPGTIVIQGLFAGWLIALMVWLQPAAAEARFWVIVMLAYLVGLAGLPHIIAGSVEALYLVCRGELGPGAYLAGYMAPTLLGNILGGVAMVTAVNHAQVVAGRKRPSSEHLLHTARWPEEG